jgi:hypothetical protein
MGLSVARTLTLGLLVFHCLFGQRLSPPSILDGTSALVALNLDAPSEVFIDGEKVASIPSAGIRKFVVSPGDHFLRVESNWRIWEKKISVPPGLQIAPRILWKWWNLKNSEPQGLRV